MWLHLGWFPIQTRGMEPAAFSGTKAPAAVPDQMRLIAELDGKS
jgi:hypothetical protein